MKILVIEDDAGTRAIIATVLRREGFLVELAENGRVGLERAGFAGGWLRHEQSRVHDAA